MSIREKLPFVGGPDPFENIVEGLQGLKGDADAVALLPYDDGTFFLKPANFDKDLIGGQGGYETADGDKIVMDGDGQPVKDLLGVPMLLGVDPTEHAAAVDPIKALVAQKDNIGEWIRVDSKGNVIEVGEALEAASDAVANADDMDAASEINVGPLNSTDVQEKLKEHNIRPETAEPQQIQTALEEVAKQGDLTKVYDIAPPAAPVINDGGEVEVEKATHIAVDQSKAKDLLPTTTSTTELNVALDKARMEEHEEGQRVNDLLLGAVAGSITVIITVVVVYLLVGVL